ncbi:MAG: RHS repeat-associated core domain-containing protein [Chitinophagales bacterium]|nr:RHS repeat-associated core domain-containing protein [Chitinophagales bacterium]
MVSDRYIYDAFGQIIQQVGTTENKYLFAGEQRDTATGLDYLRARYLNPSTGRFVSRDTFVGDWNSPVTLHRYLYANANPVMFVDPSGLTSLNELIEANKIKQILEQTTNIGLRFLNVLEKVDNTVSVVNSIWAMFNILENPSSAGFQLSQNIKFNTVPKMDEAITSLRANTGKIIGKILYTKLPAEIPIFRNFFNSSNSHYVFVLPSFIPVSSSISIPTGIKIHKRDLHLGYNDEWGRLFGIEMSKPGDELKFFRMDFHAFMHQNGPGNKDWDTWQDGNFHYHIPKH